MRTQYVWHYDCLPAAVFKFGRSSARSGIKRHDVIHRNNGIMKPKQEPEAEEKEIQIRYEDQFDVAILFLWNVHP